MLNLTSFPRVLEWHKQEEDIRQKFCKIEQEDTLEESKEDAEELYVTEEVKEANKKMEDTLSKI